MFQSVWSVMHQHIAVTVMAFLAYAVVAHACGVEVEDWLRTRIMGSFDAQPHAWPSVNHGGVLQLEPVRSGSSARPAMKSQI